jgi:hypothetical protein
MSENYSAGPEKSIKSDEFEKFRVGKPFSQQFKALRPAGTRDVAARGRVLKKVHLTMK